MENLLEIHIGHMVKGIIDDRGIAYAHFAKDMQLHRSSTTQLLNRKDWYVSQLIKAGQALHLNFFNRYADTSGIVQEPGEAYQKAAQMKCEHELEHFKKVNALLEENNSYLKKQLRALEIEINRLKSI